MFRYIRARKYIERASLTPEGFVYVVVLCFITVGSVIRNVNLLILMAGMMYAPLFINWRLAVRRLRSFRANRTLPNRIHANKLVNFQWECENILPGISAYNVTVEDQITRSKDQTGERGGQQADVEQTSIVETWFSELINRLRRRRDPNVSQAKVRFQRLEYGKPESHSYKVFFGERGKYVVNNATISTSFPFGLIISRNFLQQDQTFFVAPELGKLAPTWEQRVQSTAVGSDSIRRRKAMEEDEFYALRPWRSGDSKKNIHWRTTAKQGFPIVKQHDQQNNRDFAIILDLYSPEGDDECRKLSELVLSFAATAILEIGRDVQGQVAVAICGQHLELCRSRTPQGMISEIMPELAVAQASDAPDLEEAIIKTVEYVSNGTPIYVVSSRTRPEELTTEFLNRMQEDETQAASARSRLRRLKSAIPMVRWLHSRSEEFDAIFEMESMKGEKSKAYQELEELTKQLESA